MINDYSTETLTRLEPAYLEHYGLNEPPFASTLDERFFYPTGEINQQTNMLVHMTQYSDMLLLVTGDEGMGKTALLQHYLKSAHDNWHVSRVNANSMMDMDLLLFRIAEGFGLESLPGNSAELQELLLDKLSRLHANDILPVTIIDDADVLSQDAVELLYHLAEVRAEDGPMLHMVLFADPRIEATLQTSSVRNQVERMTHFIELQPLTEEETIQYINNRLRVAGVVDENLFAPKVFRKIFKMSGGVPARINELAHMALDDNVGAAAPDDDFDDEVYTKTAAMETEETETKPRSALRKTLLTILGMIILLLLWNQNNINRLLEGESLDDVLSSKPDIEKYMPKNQTEKPEESPFADPADKSPQTETTAVQQDTGKPDNIAANDKQGPQQTTGPAPAEDLTPVLSKLEPSPIHTGLRKIELTIHGKNFTRDSSVTLGWTGNTKQLGKKQYRVESDKVIRLQLTPGKKPDKWTLTVTDPKRGISNTLLFETVSADKKPQTEGQKENQQALDWIRAQQANHYSLQLLGSHSPQPLQSYIKQHGLQQDSYIIKTTHQGKEWYILLSGSYPDKTAADTAVAAMPAAARRNKPWARTFASIREQLHVAAAQPGPRPVTNRTLPKLDNLQAHEAWIWSQNPAHFTLQLLGTHSIDSLQQYIRQHDLQGKVVYYQSKRDGKIWYALIYGNYPDNQQARAAINALPDTLKQQRPWLRNFAAIHTEMDQSR